MSAATRADGVSRGQAWGTLALAAILYLILCWQVRGFIADDTFIHLTYAKHVRDGQGLVFNVGERVYGTTSPLWSLMLGFLGKTGVDLLLLARALSLLFGVATIPVGAWALHRLLSVWREREGLSPTTVRGAWFLGTLALAVDVWLLRWSASGMESSLGVFLVALGFAIDWRSDPPGRGNGAGVWWALAGLIRPEAFMLVLLLALRGALLPGSLATRARRAVGATLPSMLLGLGWCAYAFRLYGTIVPSTFASKAAEHWAPLHNLATQAEELVADRGVELLALVAWLPTLARRLEREWAE